MNKLKIHPIFYPLPARVSYILIDVATNHCAVIDPLLEYNSVTGELNTERADMIIDYLDSRSLTLQWVLITHMSTEYKSAANYIQQQRGGQIGVCEQYLRSLPEPGPTQQPDTAHTADFDERFANGELFLLGHIQVEVLFTPGRSPFSVSYLAQDKLFVGDCLCNTSPNVQEINASKLAGNKLLTLPDNTQVFCSVLISQPDGKGKHFESTIFELRKCIEETA